MARHLRQRTGEEQAATFLELFFDLVFVFGITQLAHHLLEHLTLGGAAETLFLLLVLWWAWIYTTWMTNWFDPEAVPVRLVLLLVMLASLLMAVAIPDAFGERDLLFAAGYAALQLVRNAFIVWASDDGTPMRLSFLRIFWWSAWVSVIWVAGAVAPDEWRLPIWLVALAADYLGPYAGYWTPGLGRSKTTDWEIEGGHFAERFQLFIIIALGESIVVTGATAAGHALDVATVLALVVAFVGSAALWWLYFDAVARRSRRDLARAADRGRMARDAFTYLHIPIVAGIILTAAADEIVISHPGSTPGAAEALAIVGGPLLYLVGHQLFRLRMVGSVSRERGVAMLALAALFGVAPFVPALASAAAAMLVLVLLAAFETRAQQRAVRLATPAAGG